MPPTITEKHPPLPLDELTAALAAFPAMSKSEKQGLITRLVARHPTLSYNWGGRWRYRRARKLRCDQDPATVDELIWRKDAPATQGRANPTGFPILYLADRRDTAFCEVRVANDRVLLAEFEILPGRSIRLVPIGEMTQIQRTGRSFLGGDASAKISDFINACDREEGTSLLITDSFLLECLTSRTDDYEISSWVARSIFDKHSFVSVVAYPTAQIFHWLPRRVFASDAEFDRVLRLAESQGTKSRRAA